MTVGVAAGPPPVAAGKARPGPDPVDVAAGILVHAALASARVLRPCGGTGHASAVTAVGPGLSPRRPVGAVGTQGARRRAVPVAALACRVAPRPPGDT